MLSPTTGPITTTSVNGFTSKEIGITPFSLVILYFCEKFYIQLDIIIMTNKNANMKTIMKLHPPPDDVNFYVDIHGYGKDYTYTESDISLDAIRDSEDKSY